MDYAKLGQRIRARREEMHFTKEALSQLAHISPSTMCLLEQGKRIPSLETFKSICDVLNVSADYLLGRDDSILGKLLPSYLTQAQCETCTVMLRAMLEAIDVLNPNVWHDAE